MEIQIETVNIKGILIKVQEFNHPCQGYRISIHRGELQLGVCTTKYIPLIRVMDIVNRVVNRLELSHELPDHKIDLLLFEEVIRK